MIDRKLQFGKVSMGTVKGTVAQSENNLDFGNATVKSGMQNDVRVVFVLQANQASADSFSPALYESDTKAGTPTLLLQGAAVSGLKKGDRVALPMALSHKRFVWAAGIPTSTASTCTALVLDTAIEIGAKA
jgi:hypothetical protein